MSIKVKIFAPIISEKIERKINEGQITVNAIANDINAESQTALMGTSCRLTLCQIDDSGIAPSLENAYTILKPEQKPVSGEESTKVELNLKNRWAYPSFILLLLT